MLVVDCDGIEVALVPWPDDDVGARRPGARRPSRILMVAPSVVPPDVRDPLEDWVRVPVDHGDVEVRARRLARIALARRSPDNGVGRDGRAPRRRHARDVDAPRHQTRPETSDSPRAGTSRRERR